MDIDVTDFDTMSFDTMDLMRMRASSVMSEF